MSRILCMFAWPLQNAQTTRTCTGYATLAGELGAYDTGEAMCLNRCWRVAAREARPEAHGSDRFDDFRERTGFQQVFLNLARSGAGDHLSNNH